MSVLHFTRLTPNARQPTKASTKAAGFDLYAATSATIPARGSYTVATDLASTVPSGTYGRIAPRSGLAAVYQIDVGAGVIDEDYTGNVKVVMFNHSDRPFFVIKGDRIAQLICEKIEHPELHEVLQLRDTARGIGGFGSSGR